MMKKLVAVVAGVWILVLGGIAQAGILVEPSVGYESGTLVFKDSNNIETKYTNTSLDGGLRLGIRNQGFWMAVEGLYASGGKSKPESGVENTYTETTAFVSIGYDFLTRIRISAGYGIQDSLVVKDTSNVEATYYGGMSGKAGLGFYLSPHTSINADYLIHDYTKYKISGVEHPITDAGASSFKTTSVLVSLSFPMTF